MTIIHARRLNEGTQLGVSTPAFPCPTWPIPDLNADPGAALEESAHSLLPFPSEVGPGLLTVSGRQTD